MIAVICRGASSMVWENLADMVCLQDAEQTKLKGYEMVYVGRELVSNKHYAQVWWVRVEGRSQGLGSSYANVGKRAPA